MRLLRAQAGFEYPGRATSSQRSALMMMIIVKMKTMNVFMMVCIVTMKEDDVLVTFVPPRKRRHPGAVKRLLWFGWGVVLFESADMYNVAIAATVVLGDL